MSKCTMRSTLPPQIAQGSYRPRFIAFLAAFFIAFTSFIPFFTGGAFIAFIARTTGTGAHAETFSVAFPTADITCSYSALGLATAASEVALAFAAATAILAFFAANSDSFFSLLAAGFNDFFTLFNAALAAFKAIPRVFASFRAAMAASFASFCAAILAFFAA